ncbi:SET domain-containing protein-lysine N-methyltransferase [Candidatus Nomurabacteria bacterium]|nr:SET domain-containing protein-lysine N-methyltransferase [Candidatus Nomurabacteria bacterium]
MIKTKVKRSTIPDAGLGLFADEFIKKGTVTWRFCPGFDQIIHEDILLKLSEPARIAFLKYAYHNGKKDYFVLCGDDERFINHSDTPNIKEGKVEGGYETISLAARDIEPGEELFCNYYDFDINAGMKLAKEGIYSYYKEHL